MIARPFLAALILVSPFAAQAGPARIDPNGLIERIPVQTPTSALSGSWQVQGRMEAGGQTVAMAAPVCDFQQAGAQLTGICRGPNAEGPLKGAMVGGHVTWDWTTKATTALGLDGVASFKGDLGADGTVRGTWTTSATGDLTGDFTLTRRVTAR
jgi:hypothetical protein